MLNRLRHGEAGFTLVEMLVAMTIGMLVLFGLFTIVDQALPATNRITARVDAQQRGRAALEQIEQQLHSAVCLDTGPDSSGNETYATPIVSADANQVTFYSGLINNPSVTASGAFTPQKVQYQYSSSAGTLVENRWTLTTASGAAWSPGSAPSSAATPTSTRTVLSSVSPVTANGPIFAAYGYDPTSGALVATSDPTKVASIGITFQVAGNGGAGRTAINTSFDDSVSMALPTDFTSSTTAANGPQCSL